MDYLFRNEQQKSYKIKMNNRLLAFSIVSIFLQGCTYRGHQDFSIVTVDNVNASKTSCDVKNAQGRWATSPEKTIVVKADEDPIYIRCENETQWGATQQKLSFEDKDLWTPYWNENGVPNLLQRFVRYHFRVPHNTWDDAWGWPGSFTTLVRNFPFPCIIFCDVFDFVNDSQYKYPRYVYVSMNNK